MDDFLRVLVLALAAMTAILALRSRLGEFVPVLAALACAALLTFAVSRLRPVLDLLERLETMTGVGSTILAPVFKTALIGILTSIAAGVCADSGEKSIASMVELCGTVMALYLSAPLVTAVLELLADLLGQ